MFVTPRRELVALAAGGSLLLLAATPASALAATHDAKPAPVKPAHVKVVHFNAHGTVVSASGSTAVVLARSVLVQHQGVRHNVSITVTLAPDALKHHKKHAPTTAGLIVGDRIEMQGTETGTGDAAVYTVKHAVQHAQPAHVFLGKITAVDGTMIKVWKGEEPSDDPAESDNGLHVISVDTSKAAITVDGAAGTLAVGQTVVVLGEGDRDAVLASSVYAFTVAPTVKAGRISAVAGSVITLGDDEDTTTVDLAGVSLVVNGSAATDLTGVAVGAKAVVLGSTDALGAFTPTLAFVFNKGDLHPAGDNHDD